MSPTFADSKITYRSYEMAGHFSQEKCELIWRDTLTTLFLERVFILIRALPGKVYRVKYKAQVHVQHIYRGGERLIKSDSYSN